MARRRKNDEFEFVELIAKLVGLGILLLFLAVGPKYFAAVLQSIFILVICAIALVGVVVLVVLFIRSKWQNRSEDAAWVSQQFQASGQNSSPYIPRIEQLQPFSKPNFIERLRHIDWFQFEKLTALVYELQGYAVTRKGGANPDGGIDLVIEKDGQRTAIQCKQWKTWNVGVKAVREFLGALTDAKINRGIFITLNGYTGDAKQLAEKHGIEIINETGLAAMLDESNLHEDSRVLEILKDTRKFCPKCEREMVLRTAGKGLNAGNQFWGCSGYPKCRFTMPAFDSRRSQALSV